MTARRDSENHLLAGALKTLIYIVNLKFPDEEKPNPDPAAIALLKKYGQPTAKGMFGHWDREANAALAAQNKA
jgi:hypothetical protein